MNKLQTTGLRAYFKLFVLGSLLVSSGCTEPYGSRVATRIMQPVSARDEIMGDPIAVATIRSIAIIPFDNISSDESCDTMMFARKLAAGLAETGDFEIIYPLEVARLVEKQNREVDIHNSNLRRNRLLGKDLDEDNQERTQQITGEFNEDADKLREPLDPVHNVADAVKIGRQLKADAVLIGIISDYDPYYRPRIAITIKALTTGHGESAAEALAQLTQWGVPRNIGGGQDKVWERQQMFDANTGGIARDIYLYARNRHTEHRPYDTEIYLRSIERYFEFVGHSLASKFVSARGRAAYEALERAKNEALRRGQDPKPAMDRVMALLSPGALEDYTSEPEDKRDRSWRRDVYQQENPYKDYRTPPEEPRGASYEP
ncbi:MAG: hypothetical protein JXA52_01620 [Planctomycetes bacterium]|nr:hypothetical protein [Planctomycetota bacterium]